MLPAQDAKAQFVNFLQVQASKVSTPKFPLFQVLFVAGFNNVVEYITGKVRGGPLAIKTDDLARFYEYLAQQGARLDDSEKGMGFALLSRVLEEEATNAQQPQPATPTPMGHPTTAPGIPGPPPGQTFSAPVVIAVLAGLTVILLAVVLVQALGSSGSPDTKNASSASKGAVGNTPAAPQPTQPIPGATSPTVPSSSPAPPFTPSAPQAGTKYWSGLVSLHDGEEELDLDTQPPHKVNNWTDGDLDVLPGYNNTDFGSREGNRAVAQWREGGTPTYQDCRTAATDQGSSSAESVPLNHYICVQTDRGRIARLKIKELHSFSVVADAIVWDGPA